MGGAACAALSLEVCYIPYRLLDGGMTGMAVVLGRLSGVKPVYLFLLLNLICLYAGERKLGARFTIRAAVALLTQGALLFLIDPLPRVFPPVVAAVLGGAGLGLGITWVLKAGGAIDGAEVLGLICQSTFGLSLLTFLFLANAVLFTFVAALYGLEPALHSILAQVVFQGVLALLLKPVQA